MGRQVGLGVEREQEVDLLLALELGGEGGRRHSLVGQRVGLNLVGHARSLILIKIHSKSL